MTDGGVKEGQSSCQGNKGGKTPLKAKLPISVVIIAHREERNLPRLLDSLGENFSEIILVGQDAGDPTLDIARRRGVSTFINPWESYRAQKEFATNKASQSWVLSLDADEALTPQLIGEMDHFLHRVAPEISGARISRKMWFMNRWITHGDWFPDRVLRLFRKDHARWMGGLVHERIEVEGKVIDLKEPMLHYSYCDLHQLHDKMQRYSRDFSNDSKHLSRTLSYGEIVVRSLWRWFRGYALRGGFLDGFPGFYLSAVHFYSTLYRYGSLKERQRGSSP